MPQLGYLRLGSCSYPDFPKHALANLTRASARSCHPFRAIAGDVLRDQTPMPQINDIVAFVLFLKNKIHPLVADAYLRIPEYSPNSISKKHADIMDIVARSRASPLYFDASEVPKDVRQDIAFVAFHSFFGTNKYIDIGLAAKTDLEVSHSMRWRAIVCDG